MRKEVIGGATLYLGDCRDVLPTLEAPAAVITSPPYGQQRDYGKKIDDWRGLVSGALTAIPDNGKTQVLVNLGLIHRKGEVVPYWEPFISDMRNVGWRFFGWYVWDQGAGLPGDFGGRFAPSHEFIFHFNRTSRKPNKTVPCKNAGKPRSSSGGIKKVDGIPRVWSGQGVTQAFRIGESVIRINRGVRGGSIESEHPAVFPVKLPRELISSYTNMGEMIIDPFMGSASTAIAAIELGRQFTGIEIEPRYFDIACRRIEAAMKKPEPIKAKPKLKVKPMLPAQWSLFEAA